MLNKMDLENCYNLTGEIRDIERQLIELSGREDEYVGDTYRDYGINAKGQIKIIRGFGMSDSTYKKQQKLFERLRKKNEELIEVKMSMEDQLEQIPDVAIRRIIRLRFFDRLSWESVAFAVDQTKSGEAMRKRLERFLENAG